MEKELKQKEYIGKCSLKSEFHKYRNLKILIEDNYDEKLSKKGEK